MNSPKSLNETKQNQILEAAVPEFQENGFQRASMDRISARSGVSKRTIYKYFNSKEELFQALIRRHWQQYARKMLVCYDKDKDIADQLREIGQVQGRILTSPDIMATTKMIMSEVLRRPGLMGTNMEKVDYKGSIEALLRAAREDGKLNIENEADAAEEFLALLKGKAFWPVIFGAPTVSEEEMSRIVESAVAFMISRYAV